MMPKVDEVLNDLVEPAIRAVLAPHEVSDVRLFEAAPGGYTLRLDCVGEIYEDWVVQPGVSSSLDEWRERLRSNLVDFVAESRFGWGQDREHGPPT